MRMGTDKELVGAMEGVISQLGGVISSKIIQNERGDIAEIHILADKSRNPKQISRDVQSAIMAKFDVSIDYKVISVAEIESGGEQVSSERIKIKSLYYDLEGIKGRARVIIEKNGLTYEGEFGGIHSNGFLKAALINATVAALNKCIGDENVLTVEDYKVVDLADLKVLVVVIGFLNTRQKELYIGNAILKDEAGDGCVKAVLNAVNGAFDRPEKQRTEYS